MPALTDFPPAANSQSLPQAQCCVASRPMGTAVIRDIIHRHRQKANHLETLLKMLPAVPTPEQEEALWQVAIEMERKS